VRDQRSAVDVRTRRTALASGAIAGQHPITGPHLTARGHATTRGHPVAGPHSTARTHLSATAHSARALHSTATAHLGLAHSALAPALLGLHLAELLALRVVEHAPRGGTRRGVTAAQLLHLRPHCFETGADRFAALRALGVGRRRGLRHRLCADRIAERTESRLGGAALGEETAFDGIELRDLARRQVQYAARIEDVGDAGIGQLTRGVGAHRGTATGGTLGGKEHRGGKQCRDCCKADRGGAHCWFSSWVTVGAPFTWQTLAPKGC
jgi:hypothetical protein